MLVEAPIRDALAGRLAAALEALRVGPGECAAIPDGTADRDTASRNRIKHLVEQAADTCEVIHRGRVPSELPAGGAFITPSLVAQQDLRSPYVQNELFGPLVVASRAVGESEVLVSKKCHPPKRDDVEGIEPVHRCVQPSR